MSFWGDVKKTLKSAAQKVGNLAKTAAPLTVLIPGVGPLAAAAIGAGGALLENLGSGGNIGDTLKDMAIGGAVGGLGGYGLGKLGNVASPLLDAAKRVVGGLGGGAEGGSGFLGFLGDAGRFLGGAVDKIGDIASLGGRIDPLQVAMLPLLIGEIQQAQRDRETSRALADQAMQFGQQAGNLALARHEELSPLRQAAIQAIPQFHDPTNPFARPRMAMA